MKRLHAALAALALLNSGPALAADAPARVTKARVKPAPGKAMAQGATTPALTPVGQVEARARASLATPPGQSSAPLLLGEVLATARFHTPQVLEALARVRGAEGRVLSTEGAFDTVFSADANTRPTGFYTGADAGARLAQPLRNNGGQLYGGYDISSGSFPSYDTSNNTARYGRIKAGAVVALLRDRLIDDRRFNRELAEGDLVVAETDQLLVAIGVQGRAIATYNNWVIAGQRLAIFKSLLALALDRHKGLRRQVEEGLRPAILLTENEQNILRRETLVAQAEQQLQVAATQVSL
ncbi:MAG: TolC family protein, partial [Sphingomonadales bacterium]